MKVMVYFEIETEDYGGEEFKNEIVKLIEDIDPKSRLTYFEMNNMDMFPDKRDYSWSEFYLDRT